MEGIVIGTIIVFGFLIAYLLERYSYKSSTQKSLLNTLFIILIVLAILYVIFGLVVSGSNN